MKVVAKVGIRTNKSKTILPPMEIEHPNADRVEILFEDGTRWQITKSEGGHLELRLAEGPGGGLCTNLEILPRSSNSIYVGPR